MLGKIAYGGGGLLLLMFVIGPMINAPSTAMNIIGLSILSTYVCTGVGFVTYPKYLENKHRALLEESERALLSEFKNLEEE